MTSDLFETNFTDLYMMIDGYAYTVYIYICLIVFIYMY